MARSGADLAVPLLSVLAERRRRDVIRYLKYFMFLARDEIQTLAEAAARAPEQRVAQRALPGM